MSVNSVTSQLLGSFWAWYFAACRHVWCQRLTAGVLLFLRVCRNGEAVMMKVWGY